MLSFLCFPPLSCQINSDGKDCETEAIGRSGRIFPNGRCRDYYRWKKNLEGMAVSETYSEDTLLGNNLLEINDILMTTSHDQAGIVIYIQAVIIDTSRKLNHSEG